MVYFFEFGGHSDRGMRCGRRACVRAYGLRCDGAPWVSGRRGPVGRRRQGSGRRDRRGSADGFGLVSVGWRGPGHGFSNAGPPEPKKRTLLKSMKSFRSTQESSTDDVLGLSLGVSGVDLPVVTFRDDDDPADVLRAQRKARNRAPFVVLADAFGA